MRKTPHSHYTTTTPKINPQRGIGLLDLMVRKQAVLSQQLAGCAAISPLKVLPMLDRLNLADLQDERARKYLTELSLRLVDFERADEEQYAEMVVGVAIDCGFEVDYLRWLALPDLPLEPIAEDAIRGIRELVISRRGIASIADYAKGAESMANWGTYGYL